MYEPCTDKSKSLYECEVGSHIPMFYTTLCETTKGCTFSKKDTLRDRSLEVVSHDDTQNFIVNWVQAPWPTNGIQKILRHDSNNRYPI